MSTTSALNTTVRFARTERMDGIIEALIRTTESGALGKKRLSPHAATNTMNGTAAAMATTPHGSNRPRRNPGDGRGKHASARTMGTENPVKQLRRHK